MCKEELIEILSGDFYCGFAEIVARQIIEQNALELLMQIHLEYQYLPIAKNEKDKIAFRSSYVIEKIYFTDKDWMRPYLGLIIDNFESVENGSMMRHYAKIVCDVIKRRVVDLDFSGVMRGCVRWAVDDKVKVAVKVWAIDILILLNSKGEEEDQYLDEILEVVAKDPSPAILCRLKKWRQSRYCN